MIGIQDAAVLSALGMADRFGVIALSEASIARHMRNLRWLGVEHRLEHLAADKDDQLGQHRIGELAAACEALGVRDHRFLGGPGRWRDSGMMDTPANERPECFWRADMDEAVRDLVSVVREFPGSAPEAE